MPPQDGRTEIDMAERYNRKLILEDGSEYLGYAFGAEGEKVCEIVFNTSMVGYQEIISDPSYTYQAVVMTYPLIGNYGICEDDYETKAPSTGALIVREYNDFPSNFRSTKRLCEPMEKYNIAGIYGVDTRKLTRSIRDKGSRRVLITGINTSVEEGLEIISKTPPARDAVSRVSTNEIRHYPAKNERYRAVVIDCGMKLNIARSLIARDCSVTVVPYDTAAEDIIDMSPDGVLISNGPGDPADVPQTIKTVSGLRGKIPMFGICLGHQLIARAYGAGTYKLKFGHRGGNHPVKNLINGKIEITSQNHSYAVDAQSIKNTQLEITHINILDDTVEGARCVADKVFSVQYHPESSPGPQDSAYLFDDFIRLIQGGRKNA